MVPLGRHRPPVRRFQLCPKALGGISKIGYALQFTGTRPKRGSPVCQISSPSRWPAPTARIKALRPALLAEEPATVRRNAGLPPDPWLSSPIIGRRRPSINLLDTPQAGSLRCRHDLPRPHSPHRRLTPNQEGVSTWCAAGLYTPGRAAGRAATARFESVGAYHSTSADTYGDLPSGGQRLMLLRLRCRPEPFYPESGDTLALPRLRRAQQNRVDSYEGRRRGAQACDALPQRAHKVDNSLRQKISV